MNIKKWFRSKALWLRGGLIGMAICIVLGVFYIGAYFPVIDSVYDGDVSGWALVMPTVTGHVFPLLAHFIIPHGWSCELTQPVCTNWSAESAPGAVPWISQGGPGAFPWQAQEYPGYCLNVIMTPSSACSERVEMIGFAGLVLVLLAVYFAAGALIGHLIQKRKK